MATSHISKSPQAFGFGGTRLLPSEANGGNLNTLTENGIYSWGPGGKPANAPWNRGVVLQERISNDSSASESFQIAASSKQNAKELKVRWRYSSDPTWDNWEMVALEEDISSHVTPATGTNLQKAKRIGNFVLLQLVSPKITTANTYQQIATVDSGYRPAASHIYGGTVQCSSTSDFGYGFVQVTSTGAVAILYSKATSYGLQCTITYYIGS